jgi:peptide/nickel transport system permease protein
MIGKIANRVAWTLIVVWFAITATFVMTVAIPANPARALLGPHSTPEAIQRVEAHYCLDRGLAGRYACYIGHLVRGDLGESYRSKRPVATIIAERVWPTIQLALAAILLQLIIGVPLGVVAAIRRNRWQDHGANVVSLLGQSSPTFVVGTLAMYVLAYRFGWFPIGGYGDGLWSRLHHLVLPAFTLAAVGVAYYARVVRSEMIDVLGEDFIRTARAKGVAERDVVVKHALRNALGPLVTLIGLDLGVLLGGAVVTEFIFAWPGLGRELLQATLELDIPLILGVVLVAAIAIALANLLVDLVYLWLDPRLRDQ